MTSTMHARHTLMVALAVLAVPLAGALPQQAAPQAHAHANTHADAAPVADLPDTAVQEPAEQAVDAAENAADEAADAVDEADDAAENASNETADEADEDDEAAENTSVAGPDTDLPAHVPDHVQRIHTLITQFLSGALDGPLGPRVSGVERPGNGR